MSFDVNIGRSEPVIKPTANMNNDGGSGGNLGYMMGGRRKKKENNHSLFDNNEIDTFTISSSFPHKDIIEMPEEKSWLKGLLNKLKK